MVIGVKYVLMKYKAVFFDLDDTLVDSQEVYSKYEDEAKLFLAESTGIAYDALRAKFSECHLESYRQVFVNHYKVWPLIFDLLEADFPQVRPYRSRALEIIMQIYTTPMKLFPDTVTVLEKLFKAKVKIALVSHAAPEIIDFKIKSTGIDKYFDLVEAVSPDVEKGAMHWAAAVEKLGAKPSSSIAVGDNIKGDMQASHEAGFRKKFWLDRSSVWSLYRSGELPQGTITIKSLSEILENI